MAIFRSIKNRDDIPGVFYVLALDIPFMAGRPEEARELISDLGLKKRLTEEWRWCTYVVEYYAGNLSEDELIQRAEPFGNARSMAYHAVALNALGHGDNPKAKEFFEKTVSCRFLQGFMYYWAKACLRCIDDPTWVDWYLSTRVE